eukprot:Tbor_TRINITY_DN5346_c3_g3::TRINITY_DN5346_c3_g3_i1::g.4190::m.4190
MKFSWTLLAFLALVSTHYEPYIVYGKDCIMKKGTSVWRHAEGTFQREKGTLKWTETNNKGEVQSIFVEVTREKGMLVLRNDERGVAIILKDDVAGIQNKGEQTFQKLYQGTWAKLVDCT